MSVFKNLFGGTQSPVTPENSQPLEAEPIDLTSQPTPTEVDANDFVSEEKPGYKIGTINYGTGAPIDAIYAYITRDYEDQGYSDALVSSDMNYRKTKEEILRNGLKQMFCQVKMRYNDDILRLNVQIKAAEEQMLNSSVLLLKNKIDTYTRHLKEIERMEKELAGNAPEMTIMIDSYIRGFMKGVSAMSLGMVNREQ